MADHNDLGKEGEEIAADYLSKKGYQIVARNYTFAKSEIDIVTKKDGLLIIVEVKTRNSDFMAGPHQTITKAKQKAIIKAANFYIHQHNLDIETRFDVVSIILNSKQKLIEHIEDAFYPRL
jgi:putative endonuclease